MSKQHLACFLYGAGDARFELTDDPSIVEPHDVLIEIAYTGVCGSDVHFWVDGGIADARIASPLIMGHEASGTIVSVGSGVTTLAPGDRVAVEPGVPCLRCAICKSGKYHLCSEMSFAACPPSCPGTLTRYFKSSESFCYKIPEALSLQEAVLIEPLSVAVHAVKLAHVQPGNKVSVFGAGPVGLLCGAVAKAFGASKVIMIDIVEKRLKFASTYGPFDTFKADMDLNVAANAQHLRDSHKLGRDGVDVVIDASGAESSIQTGINLLKMGGTYVQAGMGKANIVFPIMAMCTKELNVRGSFRYGPGDFELALRLVEEGKVSVRELITGVVPFEDATTAWEKSRRGEGIKILIQGQQEMTL